MAWWRWEVSWLSGDKGKYPLYAVDRGVAGLVASIALVVVSKTLNLTTHVL